MCGPMCGEEREEGVGEREEGVAIGKEARGRQELGPFCCAAC